MAKKRILWILRKNSYKQARHENTERCQPLVAWKNRADPTHQKNISLLFLNGYCAGPFHHARTSGEEYVCLRLRSHARRCRSFWCLLPPLLSPSISIISIHLYHFHPPLFVRFHPYPPLCVLILPSPSLSAIIPSSPTLNSIAKSTDLGTHILEREESCSQWRGFRSYVYLLAVD